jgi:hypothetical protein
MRESNMPASDVVDVGLVLPEIVRIGKPIDCRLQPCPDIEARLEAGHTVDLGVVAPQAEDLGLLWADALLVGKEFNVATHQLADQRQGVADGDLVIGANIDGLADGRVATGQLEEAATGVQHVVEVACWRDVAKLDLLLAVGDLRDYGRDHCARRLARAIGVERTGDRDRQIESIEEADCHRISADLGGAVGRLRLQWVLLVDGYVLGSAVNLASGGVDHAFDAILHRRLADIECALDIGVDVAVGRDVGVGDRDQRAEVEEDVHVLGDVLAVMRITDVAVEDLDLLQAAHVLQPAPAIEGVVLGQRFHLVALGNQHFSEVRADEAIGAGN